MADIRVETLLGFLKVIGLVLTMDEQSFLQQPELAARRRQLSSTAVGNVYAVELPAGIDRKLEGAITVHFDGNRVSWISALPICDYSESIECQQFVRDMHATLRETFGPPLFDEDQCAIIWADRKSIATSTRDGYIRVLPMTTVALAAIEDEDMRMSKCRWFKQPWEELKRYVTKKYLSQEKPKKTGVKAKAESGRQDQRK